MTIETLPTAGAEFAVFRLTGDSRPGAPELVWAHGWGQDHRAMLPLAEATRRIAGSVLLDLPGFGAAAPPPSAWGTEDYADAAAELLAGLPPAKRLWIGHSFGCRVGLRLASRHPEMVAGLFLIAAAGLHKRRSPAERMHYAARRWTYRLARAITPEGPARDRLRERFGSADYRQAGAMRPVLVKTVSEDLTAVAAAVRCPTMLVYGDRDSETPPEFGERFQRLIPGSRLVLLRGFDHWTVLTEGRHQIVQRLTEFLEQIA